MSFSPDTIFDSLEYKKAVALHDITKSNLVALRKRGVVSVSATGSLNVLVMYWCRDNPNSYRLS